MTPALSVVVCTRNRAEQLATCLARLAEQDFNPLRWQLVLVNNASTDNTDFVVRQFATRVPFPVVLIDERVPGQSRARNTGIRASSAPVIAFTDDDCYVARDFVRCLVEAFERQCVGFIGGRIVLHDPTDAEETIRPETEPEAIEPHTILAPGILHGANMAFRRSVWETIGGFDEGFGPGTPFVCDDIDFLCRASLAGYRGAYCPEPLVAHHHGRKPGPDVLALHHGYARGRGAYYMKLCLDPRVRRAAMRRWYWHLRTHLKRRRFRELAIELTAACSYLTRRI